MTKPRVFKVVHNKYDINCQPIEISQTAFRDICDDEVQYDVIEKSAYDKAIAALKFAKDALHPVMGEPTTPYWEIVNMLKELGESAQDE